MNRPRPEWLKIRIISGGVKEKVENLLGRLSLHTVCIEANCPNRIECFSGKTAAFLILGNVCTRNCTFCNVGKGKPLPVDSGEPASIAEAVKELDLKHAVITSVTRDDLPDGGSKHFASVIKKIMSENPSVSVEVLIPDFKGSRESLRTVVEARPDIINHNIETVRRLYPEIRPGADYERSLDLLKNAGSFGVNIRLKSGIMSGLGENETEMIETMKDLRLAGCGILTIGQYLPPSKSHYPVKEYIRPEQFEKYEKIACDLGFDHVSSAPLVRSSYHAGLHK